jgi:hypothetical protein
VKRDRKSREFPCKANDYQLGSGITAHVEVEATTRDYALPSVGRVGEGGTRWFVMVFFWWHPTQTFPVEGNGGQIGQMRFS